MTFFIKKYKAGYTVHALSSGQTLSEYGTYRYKKDALAKLEEIKLLHSA